MELARWFSRILSKKTFNFFLAPGVVGDRRLRCVLVLAQVGVELAGLDLAQGKGVAHDLPIDEERKINNCFIQGAHQENKFFWGRSLERKIMLWWFMGTKVSFQKFLSIIIWRISREAFSFASIAPG